MAQPEVCPLDKTYRDDYTGHYTNNNPSVNTFTAPNVFDTPKYATYIYIDVPVNDEPYSTTVTSIIRNDPSFTTGSYWSAWRFIVFGGGTRQVTISGGTTLQGDGFVFNEGSIVLPTLPRGSLIEVTTKIVWDGTHTDIEVTTNLTEGSTLTARVSGGSTLLGLAGGVAGYDSEVVHTVGGMVGDGFENQCQPVSITRGLRFYNVWAGDGAPVASEEFGVTVEDWGGRSVAILTIDEKSNKLAEKWDSGFTSKSDMRSYPTVLGGSGGKLTLNDDGWYKSFLASGYSIAGSRVERTWNAGSEQEFSQGYAGVVKSGLGVLNVTVSDISTQMEADVTINEPLIVGDWKDATLKKVDSNSETKLFDGMVFKCASGSISPVMVEDEVGAPLEYWTSLSPTNDSFQDSMPFPEESYCRIKSGHNEGSILKVNTTLANPAIISGKKAFLVKMTNPYGLPIDDIFEDGVAWSLLYSGVSITDMSTYEFFTANREYQATETATVESPVTVNGAKVSNFTHEGSTVILDNQFLSNPIQDVEVVNNNTFDMTQWMSIPSGASGVTRTTDGVGGFTNGYYISISTLDSIENTQGVSDKSIVGQSIVTNVNYTPSPEHTQWGYRTGIALSYSATNVPADSEGLCLDVSYHIPQLPQTNKNGINMNLKVVCVCVWDGDGVWASQSHTELLQETVLTASYPSGSVVGHIDGNSIVKNFGSGYFTDVAHNRQMEQFDDRSSSTDIDGKIYHRGRLSLAFDNNSLLGAYPDRVYILVEGFTDFITGVEYADVGNAELKVNEIGFYGATSTDSFDDIDEITATVSGLPWGIISKAIEQIAKAQDWVAFKDVVVNVPELPHFVRSFVTKNTELKTKQALKRILREAWCVGYINRNGEYDVVSVAGKMGTDEAVPDTHNFVLPHGCELVGDMQQYDSDDLVTGGTINYNRDSQGKFTNSITITDADKAVFDPSYAKGFDSEATAKILWDKCHLIWLKTGVLVDVRKDMQELWWLYKEDDAVNYFTNVVEWNGGGAFARDIVTASIRVADIDSSGVLPWNIGDSCRLTVPNKLTGYYSGVVEGVKYEFGFGAIVYIRVAEVTLAPTRIVEDGLSGTDKRQEDGLSGTDKITEEGIK